MIEDCGGVGRRWRTSRPSEIADRLQLLGNLFEVIALDDVAGLVFVEIAELDAALEAVADFLHVVLETAQRGEAAIVNGLAAAQHAGAGGAGDAAIGDEAAGDLALGEIEHLLDLGMADDALAHLRVEQAGHGFLHLVDQLVDDREKLDLDALALGGGGGGTLDLDVEADDDGIRGAGEQDVGFR